MGDFLGRTDQIIRKMGYGFEIGGEYEDSADGKWECLEIRPAGTCAKCGEHGYRCKCEHPEIKQIEDFENLRIRLKKSGTILWRGRDRKLGDFVRTCRTKSSEHPDFRQFVDFATALSSGDVNVCKILGFFAAHCYITADLTPRHLWWYIVNYSDLTGKSPEGRGFTVVPQDQKWHTQTRIWFKTKPEVDIAWPKYINPVRDNNRLNISHNSLCWRLFGMGFGLRSHGHDVAKIRQYVPKKTLKYFEEGYLNNRLNFVL